MDKRNRSEVIERVRQRVKDESFGDPVKRAQFHEYIEVVAPLLNELWELGYELDTLDDLRHQKKPWKTALPVLLRWLPRINDPSVKNSIVRCLSVPWVGNKATPQLVDDFKKFAPLLPKPTNPWVGKHLTELPEDQRKLGPFFGLAWAIGNALSIVDVKGFEQQIIELCTNPTYGKAREMVVLGLGRIRTPEAEEAAVELLDDDQVRLHAIIAVGQMKSRRALFQLEKLLADSSPSIRKEARKAITKIMREK